MIGIESRLPIPPRRYRREHQGQDWEEAYHDWAVETGVITQDELVLLTGLDVVVAVYEEMSGR